MGIMNRLLFYISLTVMGLFFGYGFGIVSQRMTLPLVWFYQDPTLFPRDVIPAAAAYYRAPQK